MNTVHTEAEITAEGGLKLLAPLPAWLKPGRAQVVVTVKTGAEGTARQKRAKLIATPEMLERRKAALAGLRATGGLHDVIPDPAAWQRDIRKDRPLPGRD